MIGGSAGDLLIGNRAVNNFEGGDGADTYRFAEGWNADTLIDFGTIGNNTLDFSAVASAITFTIHADGTVSVVNGANMLTNIEIVDNIIGGSGDDIFIFENGAVLNGTINGGTGINTLDYSLYTTAVAVNLATGTATGT